jgi:hypothetical protein
MGIRGQLGWLQCKTVLIAGLLLMAGCTAAPFSDNELEAREQLLLLAPIGSNAKLAKPILESKGFRCHWVPNSRFAGVDGRNDFLYCNLEKFIGIGSKRWQLALIHKNYIVTNAKFGISITAL